MLWPIYLHLCPCRQNTVLTVSYWPEMDRGEITWVSWPACCPGADTKAVQWKIDAPLFGLLISLWKARRDRVKVLLKHLFSFTASELMAVFGALFLICAMFHSWQMLHKSCGTPDHNLGYLFSRSCTGTESSIYLFLLPLRALLFFFFFLKYSFSWNMQRCEREARGIEDSGSTFVKGMVSIFLGKLESLQLA